MHNELKKHHPHLRPSERRRLSFIDSVIFLCLRLVEGGPILSTWVIISSWTTGVSLVDVIGTKSRLIYYVSLIVVFAVPINNTRARSYLLCHMLFRAFAFCLVRSCYFCCAPVRELRSFHPCLHRWLWKMRLWFPHSIGSIQKNNWMRLLLMSKLLSQQKLLLNKILSPMMRIPLETSAKIETLLTMVAT
jgi:hypothetical protein